MHSAPRRAPGLSLEEKRALAAQLLREKKGQSASPLVHRWIEAQARRSPEAVAVRVPGEALTYRELDEQANRLATYLSRLGIGPDTLVGLCVERSPRMLVGLLGILKAGGAYLPLDPAFPVARLASMLDDARPAVLMTESSLRTQLPTTSARVVCLDSDWDEIAAHAGTPPSGNPDPDHCAYVIYTSGSTGRPKGVMVRHGGLTNFLGAMRRLLGLASDDTLLAVTTLSFDIAALELWLPLILGACVEIASRDEAGDPVRLADRLDHSGATVMQATPATWRMLLESGWRGRPDLTLLCGGEALPRELADRLLSRGRTLWNLYGPTETTIWSTAWRVEPEDGPIRIGQPIDNTPLYILDARLRPVPVGVTGELYLGGAGLARGYLRRPALTAERFLPDPFSKRPGARMYRTGDLARWLADGTVECLGRGDDQVKIRGYRIEPGEVEAALLRHQAIREAAVVARPDPSGELALVAFVVPRGDVSLEGADLRQALRADLPDYMVPSAFVPLAALPLTPNGKIDRNALPSVDGALLSGSRPYVEPRGPVEQALATLWGQLLGHDRVGADDDFFELGGHSLLATQLLARSRSRFDAEVSLREFLESPTISGLARRIEVASQVENRPVRPPLRPVARDGDLPLSFAQRAMWFLDQLAPGLPTFNITAAARITGPLDLRALELAFQALLKRHEILRTAFVVKDDSPIQVIHPTVSAVPRVVDLSDRSESDRSAELDRLLNQDARTPFDLTRPPLVRATAICLSDTEHAILLTMHHIVTDGWSFAVSARELSALYASHQRGEPDELPELPVQYADYAVWQRQRLVGEVRDRLIAYWKKQLEGVPPLELPTDRPRPAVRAARGAHLVFHLPLELAASLKTLSRREGGTLYMTLLAAFQLLMHRHSGQEDFAVGSPVANRGLPEIEGLIGYFVNVLVLRADLSGSPSFRSLLARVRATTEEAFDHQDLPLDQVIEALQPPRDPSRTPVFQVMFALQNNALPEIHGEGLTLTPLELRDGSGTSKFDLTFGLVETPRGLEGLVEYDSDLFDRSTIERLTGHFHQLLDEIAADPDRPVSELPMLTRSERRWILDEWSGEPHAQVLETPIHRLVADQTRVRPSSLAVISGDHRWTYEQLDRQANRIANRLLALGVSSEDRVGLCLPKSPELIAALLGVLKAGAAYLPLELDQPPARLARIVADASPRVMIHQGEHDLAWVGESCLALRLDGDDDLSAVPDHDPLVPIHPDQLAYLIYTSGSTGTPKGVMVAHRGLAHAFQAWKEAYDLSRLSRHLQLANPTFDVFTGDWVRALGSGSTLVLCSREVMLDPPALLRLIEREAIDAVEFVPAVVEALMDHVERSGKTLDGLRLVAVGSDVWRAGQHLRLRKLCGPACRLVNSYGLTEATIDSTFFEGDVSEEAPETVVPIGRPFRGTRVHLLDRRMRPVPIGVPGELYIGGSGLARGYAQSPAQTAEVFVPDPFAITPGARLYRTGDLARWRSDGQIEFLGRGDQQVKVRGFRVELAEVEAALRGFPDVRHAVVVPRTDGPRGTRLDAYVVPSDWAAVSPLSLSRSLAERLPRPMIPASFTLLDALPLSANGKVDRNALPQPDLSTRADYVAPTTPLEQTVAAVWSEMLGLEQVGAHDDFFELGGHSLLAFQVVSRLGEALEIDIPVRLLFEAPTLRDFADRVAVSRNRLDADIEPIRRRPPALLEEAPQSPGQEAIWLFDRLHPGHPTYNIPGAGYINGPLDVSALKRALREIFRRHEILRTSFADRNGEPSQIIGTETEPCLDVVDLRDHSDEAREAEIRRLIHDEGLRRFDLTTGPKVWGTLARVGDERFLAAFAAHHIVTDGWSLGVALRELGVLYEASRSGRTSPLPPLPIQYADYAVWSRRTLEGPTGDRLLSYWKNKLEGVPALRLPTDRPRPKVPRHRGGEHRHRFGPALSKRLRDLSRHESVTPFMTLLAGFQVLLHRFSGQVDFAVGVPLAGRGRPELEGLIGYFVNVVALRASLGETTSFRALLRQVRDDVLEAFEHQALRAERLLEHLGPRREPLFQVMFVYQNFVPAHMSAPGMTVEPLSEAVTTETAKFDLTLFLFDMGGDIEALWEYDADLFDAETVVRFGEHFHALLLSIAEHPEAPLGRLSLLSPEQRLRLLETGTGPGLSLTVSAAHRLFEEQAARTPEAIAVDHPSERLTYRELNERANRLAHHLRSLGVGPESLVGLCLPRSPDLLVGLLGILKAGGAYVPLDPAYPAERLTAMLEDARVPVLLTRAGVADQVAAQASQVLDLDRIAEALAGCRVANPEITLEADHLAYVLFTSGSTGRPKGVMVPHRGLINYLTWAAQALDIGTQRAAPVQSSIAFDLTVTSLLVPLVVGARVDLLPERLGIDALADALKARTDYGLLKITPAHLQLLSEQLDSSVVSVFSAVVVIGGEALSAESLAFWRDHAPHARLVNEYGPTETVVGCCVFSVPEDGDPRTGTVPIGRPIANTRLYVLDSHLEPVPIGVSGELYIGGVGVARGYLNRPGWTADKFVPDPFAKIPGARMYRTGDLVRWRDDGFLEFLGRIDTQVKIRGYRIELGEIEAVLSGHPSVRDAVVVTRPDASGNPRLVAYLTPDGPAPESHSLKTWLRDRLPEYMVPTSCIVLEDLPLTPNGKVDRQRLPSPERFEDDHPIVAPRDAVEARLVRLWEQVLTVRPIGVTDSFFDLGGHSLLAARLLRLMEAEFGRRLAASELMVEPTIEHLARQLREPDLPSRSSPLVRLHASGMKRPFFCVHPIGGLAYRYRELATLLDADRPFFGLQAVGIDGDEAPDNRIETMARRYLAAIRSVQPEGPYLIGGWSLGGVVAFEMARTLESEGQTVSSVVLIDSSPDQGGPSRRLLRRLRALPDEARAQEALRVLGLEPLARLTPDPEWARRVGRVVLANLEALADYQPGPYDGSVTLFRAGRRAFRWLSSPSLGWKRWVRGPMTVQELPGDHDSMLSPPHLEHLAGALRTVFEAAP